jgi:hypothetical protein
VWCGEVCLKTIFPVLYNIALVKEAFMAINMDLSSGTIHWNVFFICLGHDWEVKMLASFCSLLYSLDEGEVEWTNFGGFHPVKGSLTLDLFTRF